MKFKKPLALLICVLVLVCTLTCLEALGGSSQGSIFTGVPIYLLSRTAVSNSSYKTLNYSKPTSAENNFTTITGVTNGTYLINQWLSPMTLSDMVLSRDYNFLFMFYGITTGSGSFFGSFSILRSGSEIFLFNTSIYPYGISSTISNCEWQWKTSQNITFFSKDQVIFKIYVQVWTSGIFRLYYDSASYPSYLTDPTETRYMTSTSTTVNGLTAYSLNITQTMLGAGPINATNVATPSADSNQISPAADLSTQLNEYPNSGYHFAKVYDYPTPDDASTYLYSSVSDASTYTDVFTDSAYTIPSGKHVAYLKCYVRGYGGSATLANCGYFGFQLGGTAEGTFHVNAWTTESIIVPTNPFTGAEWTQADINSMQIGCWARSTLRGGLYWDAQVTQIYVIVYYYTDVTISYSSSVYQRSSAGSETLIGSANIGVWSASYSTINGKSVAEKTATWSCPLKSLASTDSIVVRVYDEVGSAGWQNQYNYTTEQLGANWLNASTWTFSYYVGSSNDGVKIQSLFYFGQGGWDTRIANFMWTAPSVSTLTFTGTSTLTVIVSALKTILFTRQGTSTLNLNVLSFKSSLLTRYGISTLTLIVSGTYLKLRSLIETGTSILNIIVSALKTISILRLGLSTLNIQVLGTYIVPNAVVSRVGLWLTITFLFTLIAFILFLGYKKK